MFISLFKFFWDCVSFFIISVQMLKFPRYKLINVHSQKAAHVLSLFLFIQSFFSMISYYSIANPVEGAYCFWPDSHMQEMENYIYIL